MPANCGSCGEEMPYSALACGQCGRIVQPEAAQPPQAAPCCACGALATTWPGTPPNEHLCVTCHNSALRAVEGAEGWVAKHDAKRRDDAKRRIQEVMDNAEQKAKVVNTLLHDEDKPAPRKVSTAVLDLAFKRLKIKWLETELALANGTVEESPRTVGYLEGLCVGMEIIALVEKEHV